MPKPTGVLQAARRARGVFSYYDGNLTSMARHYGFGVLRRFSPLAMAEGGGFRYLVRTDDVLGLAVWVSRHYEQDVMELALHLAEARLGSAGRLSGRTFLDVGANLGTSSVPALKAFGAARGLAFEPVAANYELLRCNLVLNGLDHLVETFQVAVSDHDGTEMLELAADNSGDHRVRRRPSQGEDRFGEGARSTIEVPAARLDHFLEAGLLDPSQVGLVWVDVQGHEGQVLAGARSLMGRPEPLPFVVEFWPYGLRRCDGLELFCALVDEHFDSVLDVRASQRAGAPVELPARRLPELVERYDDVSFTDLVLVRDP